MIPYISAAVALIVGLIIGLMTARSKKASLAKAQQLALADERIKLKDKMQMKTNLEIILEEKVDPSIIGGMIIILHNEIIDGSVSHGLNAVEEQLAKVRVH